MPDPIQTKTGSVRATGNSFALSFTSLPVVGSSVLVICYGYASGLTADPTCSDNQTGNTYTRRRFQQDTGPANWCACLDLLAVVGSSGTFTVTVNDGSAGTAGYFYLALVETVNRALDVGNSANGTSTAPAPGSVTPTTPYDFAVNCVANEDIANPVTLTSPAAPWVSLIKTTDGSLDVPGESMYALLTSAAAINPTWTTSNFQWSALQQEYRQNRPWTWMPQLGPILAQ